MWTKSEDVPMELADEILARWDRTVPLARDTWKQSTRGRSASSRLSGTMADTKS